MEEKKWVVLAEEWLEWENNPNDKLIIQQYIKANDTAQLKAAFQDRIAFGTAGLRGAMRPGPAFMNTLTVTQAAQGICAYLEKNDPEVKVKGVCIGYDGRHNSKDFALKSAAIFLSRGVPVYIYEDVVPTPLLAFAIRELGTSVGIMVTASHNPKDDNGYKVYASNGAQIVSPVDKGIAQCILENLKPWDLPSDVLLNNPLRRDPTDRIFSKYFSDVKAWSFFKEQNRERKLKVTYTAMHGVGAKSSALAFESFNLSPYFPVKEQHTPDPEFPTVAFPNPEEGKGALKLAMETADRVGSPVIVANDPDADRLAAAEKVNGEWKIFSGDEIGIILGYWLYKNYRKQHPDVDVAKLAVLNTTVSCKALEAFARKEGMYYEETLTGFKWLGNRAEELERAGYKVLFAYEEAIGYMIGTAPLDKDGVKTSAVFSEMASSVYADNGTIQGYLNAIYAEINYFATNNRYFYCYDPKKTLQIFEEMRNGGKYFSSCGKYAVKHIRDLKNPGYDSSKSDTKPTLPTSSSDNLTLFFENGALISLRGSGTEPKLKYYAQLAGADPKETKALLDDIVHAVIQQLLQPEKNGLEAPKE